MVILDSNIFIYLAKGIIKRQIIADVDIAHASITKIEALGYSKVPVDELIMLESFLGESYNFPLTEQIVERAIKLRQVRHIGLGDSIIAATALENDCELWTANTEDFAFVDGLKIVNPLTKK